MFCGLTAAVLGGAVAGFDDPLRMAIHAFATPWLTPGVEAATQFGTLSVLAVLGIIAAVFLMRAGRREDVRFLLVVMGGAVALENALKYAIHRPRPAAFFGTDPATYSFPSGHALFSLCFYGAIALIIGRNRAWRPATWIMAAGLVATIGGTRIYLGVHYPSDVLGGYLAAVAWLSIVWAITGRAAGRTGGLIDDRRNGA